MTKKELVLLLALAAINFTNIMDFMIMMPMQEFLESSFSITTQQFGLLVSCYAFSAFAASMTASFMVDRFDRKHVLLVAFSGLIIGTFACGIAPSYATLIAARIVAGLFGGLIAAQGLAIVGDTFPYEKRGRAMGLLMSGFVLASIIGVPSALFIATRTDWQVPFICIGFLGLIVISISYFIVPDLKGHIKSKEERNIFMVYQGVWKDRNQQYALLMMLTLIFAHFATIPFIAPFLTKNTGFLQNDLPLMYFFGGIFSLVSTPLIGNLADKFGKHKVFVILILLSSIPVFLLTNLTHVPIYHVLIITTLFFIIAGGRMIPAQALATSVVPPQMRGGFMNLNSSLQQLSLGIAAFIGGLIITKNEAEELQHFDVIGYISIGMSMVCLLFALKVKAIQTTQADKI
ncbi:MAG: MFS transporter [Bacteroidetes bacterium]|nr:MAG: MFS transporter [Bacteroidota bacterium]